MIIALDASKTGLGNPTPTSHIDEQPLSPTNRVQLGWGLSL